MKAHHLDTNAWFVAFAPKDDPQIVIAALWEGAGHGPEAGQLLRDVMKAYFDKQARLKQSAAAPRPNNLFGSLRPPASQP